MRLAATMLATALTLGLGGATGHLPLAGAEAPAESEVEALAADFGIAFLRLDGDRACPLMTVGARHQLIAALESYLDELDAPNPPRHCPRAVGTLSAFTGPVGPNATQEDIRRDRRQRRAQIRQLQRGGGIGAITVENGQADIDRIPRLGHLRAVEIDGEWLISELVALAEAD